MSEANILESQKIPSASFRKNTIQISSILDRIKLITVFPSRQHERKRSQYSGTFSQLSLCNCKADIYEAGGPFAAWFLYCIPRSPALELALRTCVRLHRLNSLRKKDQITSLHLPKEGCSLNYIFRVSFARSLQGLTATRPADDVHRGGSRPAVQPVLPAWLAFGSVPCCGFTVFRKSIRRSWFTDS